MCGRCTEKDFETGTHDLSVSIDSIVEILHSDIFCHEGAQFAAAGFLYFSYGCENSYIKIYRL